MRLLFRQALRDERGGGPVEYIAITGIALVLASVLITGIIEQRYAIGATMGAHLDFLIASFQGGGGTIHDFDLQLEIGQPRIGKPELPSPQEPVGAIMQGASPPPQPNPPILQWMPPPSPPTALTIGVVAIGSALTLAFRRTPRS